MKISNVLVNLSILIAVLALFAAGVGLFYQDGGSSFSFTTIRGLTVQVYGQGLYRLDTPTPAIAFKMADLVTLFVAIPLLVVSLVLYRRGSLKGGLLLAGVLGYFLYNYASDAFGAAYNNLFLVYVALFGLSLFAMILVLTVFDLKTFPDHFSNRLPRRGTSIFLIVSGIILSLIWLVMVILPALFAGKAPDVVESYTTFMTGVIDLAVVAPALIVAGILVRRGTRFGYLLSATMLIFTVVLGINLTAGGIGQLSAGAIAMGQAIGMTVPFTILTVFAAWFTYKLFQNFTESETSHRGATLQATEA